MGIFTSFATGFIEGSVQKMKDEAAADAKEKELIAAEQEKYGGYLFDYLKTDDPQAGVAQMFARRAGIDTDFSYLANTMNNVENGIYLGSYRIGDKPEKWDEDTRVDNQMRAGGKWLGHMQNVVTSESGGQQLLDAMQKNPTVKNKFLSELTRFSSYYVTGQRYMPGREDVISEYVPPEADFPELFKFVSESGILPNANKVTEAASNQSLIDTETTKGNVTNPANSFVVSFYTGEGKKQDGVLEFSNEEDLDSIRRISVSLGHEDIQDFISNYNYVDVATTPEEAYDNLLSAIDMEKRGFGTLASGAMAGSTQLRAEFASYVKEEFGGDTRAAIRAYAPLVVIREDKGKGATAYDKRRKVQLAKPEDYFTRNKLNKQQVMDQYEASLNTLGKLEQLNALLTDGETPTGLKAKVQSLAFGVFGEGGQIDQFFGSEAEASGGYADGTSAASLKQVAIDRGFISKETAKNLSTMDALKLSLAAEMARAVDPSGRLSNQDFEIQLQRLGQVGWFTSKEQAQSSLNVVIDDFQRTRGRLETLYEVATQPEFTRREARILRADQIVRSTTENNFNMMLASGSTTDGETEEVPAGVTTKPSRMVTPEGAATYRGSDGKYYLDPEGTQPVNARTLKEPS